MGAPRIALPRASRNTSREGPRFGGGLSAFNTSRGTLLTHQSKAWRWTAADARHHLPRPSTQQQPTATRARGNTRKRERLTMSVETIRAIENALAEHVAAAGEGIVTNWIVALETVQHDDDPAMTSWGNRYVASDGSPNAQHGLSRWLLSSMEDIMLGDNDDD